MITFDELATLWLHRVVPKEAERGAIGLQMVAWSSQKLPPNSNALISRPNCQFWSMLAVNSVGAFICRCSICSGVNEGAGL
jgi:hypothetical protein